MWAKKSGTIVAQSENGESVFLDYYNGTQSVQYCLVAQNYVNSTWYVWAEWSDYSSMDSPGCGSCESRQCSFSNSGGTQQSLTSATITIQYPQQPLAGSVSGTHSGWDCYKSGFGSYIISGGSQITMDVYMVKVDIKRNGVSITDQNPTVSVGDKISLTGTVEPSDIYLFSPSLQWTIPNYPIKNYIATTSEGRKVDMQASDYQSGTIDFYWYQGSEDVYIAYIVSIPGEWWGAGAYFDVKRPSAGISVTNTSVSAGLNEAETEIALQYGLFTPGDNGIEFARDNYNSNGAIGSTYWLQTINSATRSIRDTTGTWHIAFNYHNILDSGVPYPYTSGTDAYDSPKIIAYSNNSSGVRVETERFSTHLMFKPSSSGAIYIPLQKVDWYWFAEIQKVNNAWSWVNRGHDNPDSGIPSSFPTWSGSSSSQ